MFSLIALEMEVFKLLPHIPGAKELNFTERRGTVT